MNSDWIEQDAFHQWHEDNTMHIIQLLEYNAYNAIELNSILRMHCNS